MHELYHWDDAMKYRKKNGGVIDSMYLEWINNRSKEQVDKYVESGYNLHSISEYAVQCYSRGKYDEVHTEYRTKITLGGR